MRPLLTVASGMRMQSDPITERTRAMAQIPAGMFVLTASHEGLRAAVPVKWVQQCSDQPPMVMVALNKGQAVEPLIRDSRSFALCQIAADDRFLMRKFSGGSSNGAPSVPHNGATLSNGDEAHPDHDPLVSLMTRTAPSGAPILDRAMSFLDCEVVRHIELDSDYRIYVGQAHWGGLLNRSNPAVCFGNQAPTRSGPC